MASDRNLLAVIKVLYANEINIFMTGFWDSGIEVGLGDGMNGTLCVRTFLPNEFDKIPDYLLTEAAKHFPKANLAVA